MNIRIPSADMNRMMKIISKCTGKLTENVEVIHDNNLLTVRGTDGVISAVATAPLLGGDGESFCVDGAMLTRVCAQCRGVIQIETSDRVCTIKGAGRTRIPIVEKKVKAFEPVEGMSMTVKGSDLTGCYGKVSYAISTNQARVALTGVQMSTGFGKMKLAALDGFQLAVEETECSGDEVRILVPGAFMKMVTESVFPDDEVRFTTDGKRVQITTNDLTMNCPLLQGQFPDYDRMMPKEFKTEALVKVDQLSDALKSGSVVLNKDMAVALTIDDGSIHIRNNSEHGEFEAEVACDVQGEHMRIGFNEKYLINALNMCGEDEAVIKFSGPVSPVIVHGKGKDGIHLTLPARIFGV